MTLVVVGYASLDYSTATPRFRGVDSTSILQRAIITDEPGIGGIAHIASASAAAGADTQAVSWVGPDAAGRRWLNGLRSAGSGVDGVAVSGSRSPSATLVEIGTGGTICLFDPADCHHDRLNAAQRALLQRCDAVVLTVAPRSLTLDVLAVLPPGVLLVWAVKHDDDAYDADLVRQLLARADVVSFSAGERSWLSLDGAAPESLVRPGALVVETRGPAGVAWTLGSVGGAPLTGSVEVEPVAADDTTGAGDTFIGTLAAACLDPPHPLADREDHEINALIAQASRAAGDLLRGRSTSGAAAGAPPKGTH